MSILEFNDLDISKIKIKTDNNLFIRNIDMIKVDCLNYIAVCSYIKKDYKNALEKTNEVKNALMNLQKNKRNIIFIIFIFNFSFLFLFFSKFNLI